jgi:hypothetical protein
MEAPRKTEDRWWQPIRAPSIQVNKKMMICQRPFSPTSWRKSSNLTTDWPFSSALFVETTCPEPLLEVLPSFLETPMVEKTVSNP